MQPVAELSELSRRSGYDGREVVLDDANIRGGTLRRSGSQRFNKSAIVSFLYFLAFYFSVFVSFIILQDVIVLIKVTFSKYHPSFYIIFVLLGERNQTEVIALIE